MNANEGRERLVPAGRNPNPSLGVELASSVFLISEPEKTTGMMGTLTTHG